MNVKDDAGRPRNGQGPDSGSGLGDARGWLSFILSLALHVLLFVLLIFLYQWSSRPGSRLGSRDTQSVGIVFSTPRGYEKPGKVGGGRESAVEKALYEPSNDSASTSGKYLPREERIGLGRSSGEQEATDGTGSGKSRSGKAAGAGSGGDGQEVGFSDLKGNGRRFVYILDRSESMKWSNGKPMAYALREAKASIASLDTKKGASKFQLVYFNEDAFVFENARLLDVTEPNKQRVLKQLDALMPIGGTDPLSALTKAIALKPDVIFFLTDADEEIPPFSLQRIRDMRLSAGVRQIHVVEFGNKTAKEKTSFKRLAEENNGQYIFKDMARLE